MKLHSDSIGPARPDGTPIPPAMAWRPPHRGGRRAPGLRRLQPYRVTLICSLWRTLFPRATEWQLSAAPDVRPPASSHRMLAGASDGPHDKASSDILRHIARHIARHVLRRVRRAPASAAPHRPGRRFARQTGSDGAWWQLHSPCDGMPAAARDGAGL
jgi:hypothetical protein